MLLGINIILGVLIATEVRIALEFSDKKVAPPDQPRVEQVPPPSPIVLPPIEHYAGIVERPLFNYDRRPREEGMDTAADKDPVNLMGIVITAGKKEALFLSSSNKDVIHGLPGEEVDGWKIVSIQADGVILSRGGLTKELKLERASPSLKSRESGQRQRQVMQKNGKAVRN